MDGEREGGVGGGWRTHVSTNRPCDSRGVSARVVQTSFLSQRPKTSCWIRAQVHQFIHEFDVVSLSKRENGNLEEMKHVTGQIFLILPSNGNNNLI